LNQSASKDEFNSKHKELEELYHRIMQRINSPNSSGDNSSFNSAPNSAPKTSSDPVIEEVD